MMKKWIAIAAVACMVLVSALAAGCGVGTPGSSLPAVGQNVEFGKWGASGSEAPIEWTVLSNDGSTALLISTEIIDVQMFDATSSLHTWLNSGFYSGAFTQSERAALSGASGDKVSLLSLADAQNTAYFADNSARAATATAYAQGEGLTSDAWWLSTSTSSTHIAYSVNGSGAITSTDINSLLGVRPVIRLNLSAVTAVTEEDIGSKFTASSEGDMGSITSACGNPVTLVVHDASMPSLTIAGYTVDTSGLTVNCTASAALTGDQKVICLLADKNSPVVFIGWSSLTGGHAHFNLLSLAEPYQATLCVATVTANDASNYAGALSQIDTVDGLKITGIKAGDTLDKGSAVTITAASPGTDNADPAEGDMRWAPVSWSVLDESSVSQGSGTWSGAPFTAAYTPMADGPQTLSVVFRNEKYTGGDWAVQEDLPQTRSVQFTVAEPITLSLSPASGQIYTGGRITITPSIGGGSWSFDSAYLSRNGNEFTGLKAGKTRVTYTLDDQSVHADVTILASSIPATGQDFTLPLLLGSLALLAGLAAAASLAMRKTKKPAE